MGWLSRALCGVGWHRWREKKSTFSIYDRGERTRIPVLTKRCARCGAEESDLAGWDWGE